jgi:hypothetical protein
MRIFLAVLVFCVPVLGQATYAGPDLYSGSAIYTTAASCAAPNFCAYTGTDVIPWATAPNLGGSTNNGVTAYDSSYLSCPADPGGKCINWDGSQFTSAANLSPVTRITDSFSAPGRTYTNFFAGQGGSGVFTLTNTNTTLVGIGDAGGMEHICLFNPTGANKGHCTAIGAGVFITTNLNTSGGGSAATTQDFGSISFSLTDPTRLFTFGTDSFDNLGATAVTPFTINISTGAYIVGSPVVDFKYGLPAQNAANWAASTSYGYGAYVIHPLTASEMWNGAGTWTGGIAVDPGDIVSSGGATPCMYRATTGGTTAGTAPAFLTSAANPCKNDVIKESTTGGGAVVWRGTNSSPQFIYQNTTTSCVPCTSNSSSFTWIASGNHPDFLSTASDPGGITWTNIGPACVPANANQLWTALGGISSDTSYGGNPSKYGLGVSTNTYGDAAVGYNKYNADQGTGVWLLEYDATLNVYHLLNTGTGIWTDYACGSGSGATCSNISSTVIGTLTAITNPLGTGQPCPFLVHNMKIGRNGLYALVTSQVPVYAACNSLQNFEMWSTTSASFCGALTNCGGVPSSLQITYGGMNHWALGTNKIVAFEGGSSFGYTAGVFTSVYNNASASTPPLFSVWLKPLSNQSSAQTTPPGCYVTSGTEKSPDCNLSEVLDSHLSWVGDPGTDTYPVCGTSYNYATLGPAFNAWQNMETCYPTIPTGCDPSVNAACAAWPSSSLGPVWQFSHTFATGTSTTFSTQFQISEYSQDANWLFWSSDWNCQNGSNTGAAPTVYSGSGTYVDMMAVAAVPAAPTSLCGLPWAASTTYVVGNMINPIEGTAGAGAVDDVFQAIYVGGPTGSTQPGPAVPNSYFSASIGPTSSGPGSTICDSASGAAMNPALPYTTSCPTGTVWQDIGPQNQRGDVFAVNLGNQH